MRETRERKKGEKRKERERERKKREGREGRKEEESNSKEHTRCERGSLLPVSTNVEIRSYVSPLYLSANSPLGIHPIHEKQKL